MSSVTLTARWIFPVSEPPLERGTVTISGPVIRSVEPFGLRHADLDLGNVAILPGLVNAHTHLDLTGLKGRLEPNQAFVPWLRSVVRHRRGLSPQQAIKDIQSGVAESVRHGTTLMGDISSLGWSWPVLAASPLRAVVFYELVGLPKDRAELAAIQAVNWLNELPAALNCRPGLSPHAPYSVRASLFEEAFRLASDRKIPLAAHLAETIEELELLEHRRGPFVDFLSELGVWDPDGLVKNLEDVVRQAGQLSEFLIVHGNYLTPYQFKDVTGKATVVYCPRTHAAFSHAPHPFRIILACGGHVALGTDSLASNPDLDILAEARFLRITYPDFPGDQLLRMLTLSGAEALGWDQETGSLVPGKSADLVVLPLPLKEAKDPYDLIFESSFSPSKVMWRGSWVDELESPANASAKGQKLTPIP